MVRFHSIFSSACDRAAQVISRTALLSLGLLTLCTGLGVATVHGRSAEAAPEFTPFESGSFLPRPLVSSDPPPAPSPIVLSPEGGADRFHASNLIAPTTEEAVDRETIRFERFNSPLKLTAADAVPLLRPNGNKLQDGLYLFGESPLRDQKNQAYLVFQVEGHRVSGAVYWYRSSHDCFEGRFSQDRLALRVKAAYSGEIYQRDLAIAPQPSVLAAKGAVIETGLEGMYRLDSLTENDRRILAACQAIL